MWRSERSAEGGRDKTVVEQREVEREGFVIKKEFIFGSNNKIIGIDNSMPEMTGINNF